MPASVPGSSASSSRAGTTTATRLPSTIGLRAFAAWHPGGDRFPEQRDDDPDEEADDASDEGRAAPARGRSSRDLGRLEDAGELDLLGKGDRVVRRQETRLEVGLPTLGELELVVDARAQDEPVGVRQALVVVDLRISLLVISDALSRQPELLLHSLAVLLERAEPDLRESGVLLDDNACKRIRSRDRLLPREALHG